MRRGRYYIGRVIKSGLLDQFKLMEAIKDSSIISLRNFTWTITDVTVGNIDGNQYICGRLSKFSKEGHVTIVDEEKKSQLDALAPNLLEASSPFVYLPAFSGIAYLHVWNGIQEDVFRRRFQSIIEAAYDNFFVECTIEPIADYKTFVSKVSKLANFHEISAKVNPPNPLFGRIWSSLDEYIKHRNADEIVVRETKEGKDGIKSQLVDLINAILENPNFEPNHPPDITDAALLMAADGYGTGKVMGREGDSFITIKTGDSQKSFLFDKNPNPHELAVQTHSVFEQVSYQRNMRHRHHEG